MGAKIQLCSPEPGDLLHLAENLRAADLLELKAVHGDDVDVLGRLINSVVCSSEAKVAVTAYGEPIAVFGVAPVSVLTGKGCPWMLGTDTMDLYGRNIVQLSRAHVARWLTQYPTLFNYVDVRNEKSIRWLKRSGFIFEAAAPHGLQGLPFHYFYRGARNL